ncbi:hypothetical protein [Prescottella agglutinans]|uniref:hypothetical protein n=1 Tax=Prescottella agglutinans TaxID=1644129 RepID=UPI003D995314
MVSSASFVFFESTSPAVSMAHAGDRLRDASLQVVDHDDSLEVSDGQGARRSPSNSSPRSKPALSPTV